ncbi:sulfatase family protein [Parapedobacter indicus]|uniref:Arylsulfatase n=1 Tax=Parapedobacter indicus TaxID=1477437 RepID=A0A1I3PR54_9SPHI|nr:sulfatase [Parapedobacter indicus]PPL00542.1 arylsulfatase [Parapedobacter indicus]SFJ23959.1 arylsulfatase [Parapedobacter indicus]
MATLCELMKTNHLRLFVSGVASLLLVVGLAGWMEVVAQQRTGKPNVVIIFVDDMGYGDLAAYGATQYQTPHLDQLAKEGMRFTHFYAAQAICSASRAGLLTGCYPNRIGFSGALSPKAETGLDAAETTIAELVKSEGYHTAAIGKWHLGHHRKFLPLQQGFDEYLGLPYSNDMVPFYYDGTRNIPPAYERKKSFPELPLIQGNERIRELRTLADQDELTTLYTETAVDFIERNHNSPFFLYLAHSMPHVPLAVSDKFKGKSKQGLYGDVMMELDWSVGEIMKALDAQGIADQTLVVFASDNGPWMNFGDHAGSAGGLREGKATSFEGGQRVPCIMRWPDVIPAGTICGKLASTIDILPTVAKISGAELPTNKIDGVNILPLLYNEVDANPRDHFYYYFGQNNLEAVRQGGWKLVFQHRYRSYEDVMPGQNGLPGEYTQKKTGQALYDLRRDPGERYDVSAQHPDVVKELIRLAEQARDDLGDDLTGDPGKNRRPIGHL